MSLDSSLPFNRCTELRVLEVGTYFKFDCSPSFYSVVGPVESACAPDGVWGDYVPCASEFGREFLAPSDTIVEVVE